MTNEELEKIADLVADKVMERFETERKALAERMAYDLFNSPIETISDYEKRMVGLTYREIQEKFLVD